MSDKNISPRQAALAILAKAAEIVKKHKLAKATGHERGVHTTPAWQPEKGKSYAGTAARASATSSSPGEAKFQNEEAKESHKQVIGDLKAQPKPNLEKDDEASNDMEMSEDAQASHTKGHIKLAKFVGRMDQKRGKPTLEIDKTDENPAQMSGTSGQLASKETGHEKGINVKGNRGVSHGISEQGGAVRDAPHQTSNQASASMANAKDQHKQTLGDMKQMPKPKLPG